jgi:argininosuccinate lyase
MKHRSSLPTGFPHPAYLDAVLRPNFQQSVRHFLKPLIESSQAHVIMLARCGILQKNQGAALLRALHQIAGEQKRLEAYCFRGVEEDLFFYIENRLADICGPEISGHLSVARSRNDVDMALYRMVLRTEIYRTAMQVDMLQQTLLELTRKHVQTLLPVVTHTQLAQPTTLGHFLMAAAEFLERDFIRLAQAFHTVNQCPLGACVATTTGFPIDRELLVRLLGFDSLLENSYGCIASVDYLVESAGVILSLMVNLGRFIQDLLLWTSQAMGFIDLPDGFVQCSSIMPQKRNPVALEHLRILASNTISHCQGVILGLHNTPFGDIVDTEDDIQPIVRAIFEYTSRVLELLTAVLRSVDINVDRAALQCRGGEITLTELADWLVRNHRLPFRTAHSIVSQVARELRKQPSRRKGESHSRKVSALVEESSAKITGSAIRIPVRQISQVLDPINFVRVRKLIGGPAPQVVKKSIESQLKRSSDHKKWLVEKEVLLNSYAKQLNRI